MYTLVGGSGVVGSKVGSGVGLAAMVVAVSVASVEYRRESAGVGVRLAGCAVQTAQLVAIASTARAPWSRSAVPSLQFSLSGGRDCWHYMAMVTMGKHK